jgi:hypothetical protein
LGRIANKVLVTAINEKTTVLVEPDQERMLSYAVDLGVAADPGLCSDNGLKAVLDVALNLVSDATTSRLAQKALSNRRKR